MTIRQKLEHAKNYGYQVRIEMESGSAATGDIRSLSKTGVSINGSVPYCLDRIVSVELAIDDTPDVEIVEIDRDEIWRWREPGPTLQWKVKSWLHRPGVNVYLRTVAEFAEEKDAKATATLPELVKQRDKLLEAAKPIAV